VEDLKQLAQATVTSPANIDRRARILLEWANAYSLAGGVTPVELPLNAGLVTGYKLQARAGISLAWTLDQMIQVMRLRDEQPEAIGTLTTSTLGPFRAGSYVSFSQTYTVGSQPLKAGGGIMIARHIFNTGGRYQTNNPEPGVHRISIRSKDGAIEGKTNPVLVEKDPEHRIYWGDTHGHSGFAEGRFRRRLYAFRPE